MGPDLGHHRNTALSPGLYGELERDRQKAKLSTAVEDWRLLSATRQKAGRRVTKQGFPPKLTY